MARPETNAFFGGRRVGFPRKQAAVSFFQRTPLFFRCFVLWRFDCLISLWFALGRRGEPTNSASSPIFVAQPWLALQLALHLMGKSWMDDQIYHQHYLWGVDWHPKIKFRAKRHPSSLNRVEIISWKKTIWFVLKSAHENLIMISFG